jgi:Zn-dependent protease with chaperone function
VLFAAAAAHAGKRPRGALEPSSVYAVFVMSKIADAAGLGSAPAIYRAPCDAAHAVVVEGREAIVYNAGFLDDVNDRAGTPWAAVSVIAHELGHHVYGHSHERVEDLPSDVLRARELEADYFSGFVLSRMGASRAAAAAAQEALFEDDESPTHPDSYRRLAAIFAGWDDGASGAGLAPDPYARAETAEREGLGLASAGLAPAPGGGRGFPSGLW